MRGAIIATLVVAASPVSTSAQAPQPTPLSVSVHAQAAPEAGIEFSPETLKSMTGAFELNISSEAQLARQPVRTVIRQLSEVGGVGSGLAKLQRFDVYVGDVVRLSIVYGMKGSDLVGIMCRSDGDQAARYDNTVCGEAAVSEFGARVTKVLQKDEAHG